MTLCIHSSDLVQCNGLRVKGNLCIFYIAVNFDSSNGIEKDLERLIHDTSFNTVHCVCWKEQKR